MTDYTPDRWAVIKFDAPDGPLHKVFGSWKGGYLDGDSWRMNSGVDSVTVEGDLIIFHGLSGSTYTVHKDAYGVAGLFNNNVIETIVESHKGKGKAEIMSEDTDWTSLAGVRA